MGRQAEGKAFVAHPALMDRSTPISSYTPGRPREDSLLSQRQAGHHAQAYGGREAIDWVYDCVGLYSDSVATAPFRLEKLDGTQLVRQRTDLTPPEYEEGPKALYALLDTPNPFMLYDELMSLLAIDLLLVGNHYWFKWNWGTPAAAIYRLAPSHVKIKPGPYGPKSYVYQPPGVAKPLNLKPEDIIHFRRPNPHDAYYGMGVIQGAGRSMDLELAITNTMASYFENKADPSLIIQSERRVPRDVFNKLRAQLRSRVAGSDYAGELLVLESGLKASTLSASASDAMFEQLAKMSRDRILAKFRASPMLFGLMDGASSSSKVSDARREFDNYALRPFMERVERMISETIAKEFDCRYIIDHRQILPPEEAIKVGESIAKLPGVKVREVRRQYAQFGLPESTGDPEIDNLVINVPGEELDEDGQGVDGGEGLADQPLGSEAGRPPLVKNTAAFGVASAKVRAAEGKAFDLSAIEATLKRLEGKSVPALKQAPDNRLPGEQRPDDSFASVRQTDLDSVSSYIATGLAEAAQKLERDLLDHVEGKALKTSDLVGRVRRSEAWKDFKARITEVLEEGSRRAAQSGALHTTLSVDDELDYNDIVKSVVHRPDGLRSIMKTIRDRVVARIKEAREAGAERHEYEAVIRATLSDWSASQARTIAETEAVHSYNEAALTISEMAGVDLVFVEDGDDHDAPCQEANGSVWTIEHARANRLEHPHCRRAFIPLTDVAVG